MTGRPGKWPWAHHSVAVTPLIPTIRFASASYSTIRSTMRIGQRCGMSASISRVVWTVSVTGGLRFGSVWRCVGVEVRSGRRPPGRRRSPTRSRRFVVIRPSRKVSLSEQRLVDLDVRGEAVDDELVEGGPAALRSRSPGPGPRR